MEILRVPSGSGEKGTDIGRSRLIASLNEAVRDNLVIYAHPLEKV
jgi:hypothetical protein